MNAARELAQLLVRALDVFDRLLDEVRGVSGTVGEGLPDHLEAEDRVHEPLLSAVVQVAFDPLPGLVGGGDDPRPRRDQLAVQLGVVE